MNRVYVLFGVLQVIAFAAGSPQYMAYNPSAPIPGVQTYPAPPHPQFAGHYPPPYSGQYPPQYPGGTPQLNTLGLPLLGYLSSIWNNFLQSGGSFAQQQQIPQFSQQQQQQPQQQFGPIPGINPLVSMPTGAAIQADTATSKISSAASEPVPQVAVPAADPHTTTSLDASLEPPK